MDLVARRARLAGLEAELARLAREHEAAMSRFRFDEAKQWQDRIAPLERERAVVAASLSAPAPLPTAGVPRLARVRRGIPGRRSR